MARVATKVAEDFFDSIQLDAGVLVKAGGSGGWSVESPRTISDTMIITATTGGISAACTPAYSDLFSDVDNAPNNTKQGLHLDGWTCTLSTTAVNNSLDNIKLALGAATKTVASNVVKPRSTVSSGDFTDIAWIGDMADGSVAAIVLKNALSTGGFSLQTTKNGKGTYSLTLTGYVDIEEQTVVPMEFYVFPKTT